MHIEAIKYVKAGAQADLLKKIYENLSEEGKKILEQCEQLLKESEEQRQKIADKFKELLVDTGACVIRKPTLERAAITYIIYLIEQIIISAKDKTQIFTQDDFSISNFISIKDEYLR